MHGLLAIAEQVIVGRLISNAFPVNGTTKAGLGLIAVSGFMLVLGFGFMFYGIHLHLIDNYSADVAAMYMGGMFAGLGLLAALISHLIFSYRKRKVQQTKEEVLDLIQKSFQIIDEEIGHLIKENPKASTAAAGAAGFMVGDKVIHGTFTE